MGANAGLKLLRVVENTGSVLGILLLAASQAIDYRRPHHSSPVLERMHSDFRKLIPFRSEDLIFKPDMDAASDFILRYQLEEGS
jgi:histidine ammonia-lyase